jgi:hypothetical protein
MGNFFPKKGKEFPRGVVQVGTSTSNAPTSFEKNG